MSLNLLLAISGVLMLFCVFANRISDRYDIPALLLFLGLGMLAGNEGVGHIHFYNAKLSNHIGTVALIFILFSGGLETKWNEIKPVIFRGTLLSTLGVILTALILFLCSHYLLRLPIEVAMLLSTIVSSTDAPAVFNLMRSQQDTLSPGLKPLLEFESGSNDPMAVLLSMGAISLLSAPEFRVIDVLADFIIQMVLGLVMGLFIGRTAAYILGRMKLNYLGLYPVFGIGTALVSFGFTELLNGNGYLAVYLTGISLGNEVFLYRRHLIRFHDSLAWIMQIGMFLILGLLVNPSELKDVAPVSFACSLCLMFIARPVAVLLCLSNSSYNLKEKIFISWAGLKGAVPIILATYPLMIKFPNSQFLFNTIFFLVIISVLFQGKSLNYLARKLNLYEGE